jgi:hypothetical protein
MYKKLEYLQFITTPYVGFDVEEYIKCQEWYVETDIYVATWRDAICDGDEGYEIYKVVN